MDQTKEFLGHIQKFFQGFLSQTRGLSPNTILAYRDTLKLFLVFVVQFKSKSVSRLTLEDLDADTVLAFLKEIEHKRKKSKLKPNNQL